MYDYCHLQGHTVGHAMTGALGMGGGHSEAPAPQSQEPQQPYAYQEQQQPYGYQPQQQAPVCQFELKQFMDCTQHQSDLTLCQAFNDALRDCKLRNGRYYPSIHVHTVCPMCTYLRGIHILVK